MLAADTYVINKKIPIVECCRCVCHSIPTVKFRYKAKVVTLTCDLTCTCPRLPFVRKTVISKLLEVMVVSCMYEYSYVYVGNPIFKIPFNR